MAMAELDSVRMNLMLLDKLRAQGRAAADFSAEARELRALRSGQLKIPSPATRLL
jgi:hypothetical protein